MRWLMQGFLMLGLATLGWAFFDDDAKGKSRLKKQRFSHRNVSAKEGGDSHDHEHDHDHGHNHSHSKWQLSLGLSYSARVGSAEEEEEEEHDHDHALALHEGHSHGGGGEDGASEVAEPLVSTSVGYRIIEPLSLKLSAGYGFKSGVLDPNVATEYSFEASRSLSWSGGVSFSAPLSKASQDSYKMTTIAVGGGPTWAFKRYTVGGRLTYAKSYYSKTIIVEEEEPRAFSLEDDHDHDHGEDHDHGHELGDEGTGDREFDRTSLSSTFAYRLMKRLQVGAGAGGAHVTHQFGPSTIETLLTIPQVTYTVPPFAGSAAFFLSSDDESFTMPHQPGFSLGILYVYE